MASPFGSGLLLGSNASGASAAAAALLGGTTASPVVSVLPAGAAAGTHLRGRGVAVFDGKSSIVCALKKGEFSGEGDEEHAEAEIKLLSFVVTMASKTLNLLDEIASKAEMTTMGNLHHHVRALLDATKTSAISGDDALLRLLDLQGETRLAVYSGSNYALPPLVAPAPGPGDKAEMLVAPAPGPGGKGNLEAQEEEYFYSLTPGEWDDMSGIARAMYSTHITLLMAAVEMARKKQ